MRVRFALPLVLTAVLFYPTTAHASLTTFQTFVGHVAVSTDGFGSLSQSGTISASVPVGATVLAAYLYTATQNAINPAVAGLLNGSAIAYGASVPNNTACCNLASNRANVTAIVAPVINGGPGGIYNFSITETNEAQDGEGLVVVYSLPALPTATVGILDGFTAVGGDATAINFASALDPTAPGFFAEMRLGIGFSCCSGAAVFNQRSNVTVNGTLMTANAGDNDDGLNNANGSLITVGGFDDPFGGNPVNNLVNYAADHERYNLVPFITLGQTSIAVNTNNPSNDDNIFLAVFHVTGEATVTNPNIVPEPGTLTLLGLGGAMIFRKVRRRKDA